MMNDKGNEEFSCSGNNVIASGAGHRESIRRAPRPLNTNLSWKKGNESRGILFSFHVNLPRGWKNPSEQHKFVVGLLLSNYSLVIQRLTSCIPFKKKKKYTDSIDFVLLRATRPYFIIRRLFFLITGQIRIKWYRL